MEDLTTIDKDVSSQFPLVSVVVVTYNSSATIIETLNSIKSQTYKSIELIVTDDCSPDNTVSIVKQWLEKNDDCFVYAQLICSDKNTGVSGNLNRGILGSHGEWIKSIAGDDLLIPTAIEEYVKFVSTHYEKVRMCVCDVEPFAVEEDVPDRIVKEYNYFFEKESEPYVLQRKRVMTSLVFVGPAYFYSRELYDEVGGYSEKYGCAEEWPFVYKIIMAGNRIYALNKKLVRYRVSPNSLCNSRDDRGLGNQRVFNGMYRHFFDHPFKDFLRKGDLLSAWHYALYYWGKKLQYMSDSDITRKVLGKTSKALSPLTYFKKLHIVNTL